MTTFKFVVKVNRTGSRIPAYVHSVTGNLIQMTPHRKQALVMGKLVAEDAINSIRNSRSTPELLMVKMHN